MLVVQKVDIGKCVIEVRDLYNKKGDCISE